MQATISDARAVVLSCIEAINQEDFSKARTLVTDDMQFVGVLGSREGAEAYFADMKKMKLKYMIRKVIAEADDVCVFYDLAIGGTTIFGCGWYHLKNGKIHLLRVLFDPRPILEETGIK